MSWRLTKTTDHIANSLGYCPCQKSAYARNLNTEQNVTIYSSVGANKLTHTVGDIDQHCRIQKPKAHITIAWYETSAAGGILGSTGTGAGAGEESALVEDGSSGSGKRSGGVGMRSSLVLSLCLRGREQLRRFSRGVRGGFLVWYRSQRKRTEIGGRPSDIAFGREPNANAAMSPQEFGGTECRHRERRGETESYNTVTATDDEGQQLIASCTDPPGPTRVDVVVRPTNVTHTRAEHDHPFAYAAILRLLRPVEAAAGHMPFGSARSQKVQLVLVNSRQPTTYYARPGLVKKQRESDGNGGESGGRGEKAIPVCGTLGIIKDEYDDKANVPSARFCAQREAGRVFSECCYSFLHSRVYSISDLPSLGPFSPTAQPQHSWNPLSTGTGAHSIAPSISPVSTIKPTLQLLAEVEGMHRFRATLRRGSSVSGGNMSNGMKADGGYPSRGTTFAIAHSRAQSSALVMYYWHRRKFDDAHHEVSYDSSLVDLQTSTYPRAAFRASRGPVQRCPAWRAAQHNTPVCVHRGRSLEEYILPLSIQSLPDIEETVVSKVLAAFTSLCELGLFQKMRICELMSATLGFPHSPEICIRQGAAAFTSASAKHLPAGEADPTIGAPLAGKCDTTSAVHEGPIHQRNAVPWIALGRVEAWDIEESTLEIHTTGTDSESLKPDSVAYAPGPANTAARKLEAIQPRTPISTGYPTTTSVPGGFPISRSPTSSLSSSGQDAS
ncbi:hypothetical protein FIBSPDRAFT_931194 [Athelia psychrophila]|uniref:Phosphatase 2A Regulatory Subunit A helical domain-containing protein n=1 Tax=Athelia psychrophila TaxID=1759441 RepID=A0A166KR37_9AGAM|nr:hypothetical protein FIBSPDRAFT_931194 [Fibularhizoctonia sp. CBS 109695]